MKIYHCDGRCGDPECVYTTTNAGQLGGHVGNGKKAKKVERAQHGRRRPDVSGRPRTEVRLARLSETPESNDPLADRPLSSLLLRIELNIIETKRFVDEIRRRIG